MKLDLVRVKDGEFNNLSFGDAFFISKALKYKYNIPMTVLIKENFPHFYGNLDKGIYCNEATKEKLNMTIQKLNENTPNLISEGRKIVDDETKFKSFSWNNLIVGLKRYLKLTNEKLSEQIGINESSLAEWARNAKKPNYKNSKLLLKFVKEKNLDLGELLILGKSHQKIKKVNIDNFRPLISSIEFSEILGILGGDGSISISGQIGISGSSIEDREHHERRIIPLFEKLFNKRVSIRNKVNVLSSQCTSIKLVYFLKELGIPVGKKNNLIVPDFISENVEHLSAYLRGLFDTDGSICKRNKYNIRINFGAFKEAKFADKVFTALKKFDFSPGKRKHPEGRIAVDISNDLNVIKFFQIVGSSNPSKIARFLCWRLEGNCPKENYELVKTKLDDKFGIDVKEINLPFFWKTDYMNYLNEHTNKILVEKIREDSLKLIISEIKNNINWKELVKILKSNYTLKELTKTFNCSYKTIWQWQTGFRKPNLKTSAKILNFCNDKKIKIHEN